MDRGKPTAQLWPWLYATTVAGCVYVLFTARDRPAGESVGVRTRTPTDRPIVAPRFIVLPAAVFLFRLISYGSLTNAGAYLHAAAQAAVYVLLPLIAFNVRGVRFSDLRRAILAPLVLI